MTHLAYREWRETRATGFVNHDRYFEMSTLESRARFQVSGDRGSFSKRFSDPKARSCLGEITLTLIVLDAEETHGSDARGRRKLIAIMKFGIYVTRGTNSAFTRTTRFEFVL